MVRIIVECWIYGSALLTLIFLFTLFGPGPKLKDEFPDLYRFIRSAAPGYIVFWPWRIIVWPALYVIEQHCHKSKESK